MEAGGSGVPIDVLLRKTCALRHMRKFLREEREVGGDFHQHSEVPSEGTCLQRREEGLEFSEVGALGGFLLLDGLDDGGEAVLEVERRNDNRNTVAVRLIGSSHECMQGE